MLEDHRDLLAPDRPQAVLSAAGHVLSVDADLARGRRDEAVQHPHKRGLARAGEPHHHEDLALGHVEAGVLHAHGCLGFAQDLFLALALPQPLQGFCSLCSEDLEHVTN